MGLESFQRQKATLTPHLNSDVTLSTYKLNLPLKDAVNYFIIKLYCRSPFVGFFTREFHISNLIKVIIKKNNTEYFTRLLRIYIKKS